MSTLSDLKSTLADDLARTDLTSQIARAITEAITFHGKERFWFNCWGPSNPATFSTVAGQANYTSSDDADIPLLIHPDAVFATVSSVLTPALGRVDPDQIFYLNTTSGGTRGQPIAYAFDGSAISLYPKPDQAYSISILGHYRLDPPASDGASNAWTTEAFDLIRASAKASLFLNVIREVGSANIYYTAAKDHLEALRRETGKRAMSGRIRSWSL
jgi:hypothetical protein